jgi:starvation-inducible DNA-binding protein
MEKNRISAISTDLSNDAVVEISGELRKLLADVFALYVKDEELPLAHERPALPRLPRPARSARTQIFAITDDLAERARKIGGTTLRSVSDISKHQRLRTTTTNAWPLRTCWPSFGLTIRS